MKAAMCTRVNKSDWRTPMCSKANPHPGPEPFYAKNRLYFGFEAFGIHPSRLPRHVETKQAFGARQAPETKTRDTSGHVGQKTNKKKRLC